jgi:hypothetical protein
VKVVYVAGLADVKPNSSGSLSLTPSSVAFVSKGVEGTIAFDRITVVSVGNERIATGGVGGKVVRAIPFFGFGAAMGAVTNKSVGLLTIEYVDKDGGQHGAVFEVPKTQVDFAQKQISSRIKSPAMTDSRPCSGTATSDSILVQPIAAPSVELPAEYRALLYEELVDELRASKGSVTVYRAGDSSAPCRAKKLELSVTAFKKGNEAVRASTGPIGLFVGGTSVTFHVRVVDAAGRVLFERSHKVSRRGDGDSLGVTRDLAKSVSKKMAKAEKTEAHTTPQAGA